MLPPPPNDAKTVTETYHASCIAVGGQAVLLQGPSGCGKSDFTLRLLDEAPLFAEPVELVGDDYCCYARGDNRLYAHPAPALDGLLEARGLGIFALRPPGLCGWRPVVLHCHLRPSLPPVERLPEACWEDVLTVRLPSITLDPWQASASARLRLALRWVRGLVSRPDLSSPLANP